MSDFTEFALREFKIAGWCDENGKFSDDYQESICKDILEILVVVSRQEHSESSLSYLKKILYNLLDFKPISPLTGEDDEWVKISEGLVQNRRMSTVFKSVGKFNGQAYWIDGKIFYEEDENGKKSHFTNFKSHVPIAFPFSPDTKPDYVRVERKK